jgi:hypothetical protein
MPIDPKDLFGSTLLKATKATSHCFRAKIVQTIVDKNSELQRDPFLCEVDGYVADDIFT